jgi:hypothetical protein
LGVADARFSLKCAVCKEEDRAAGRQFPLVKDFLKAHPGACLECSFGQCRTAFHVSCAEAAGYRLELHTAKGGSEGPGGQPRPLRANRPRERDDLLAWCVCPAHLSKPFLLARERKRKQNEIEAARRLEQREQADKAKPKKKRKKTVDPYAASIAAAVRKGPRRSRSGAYQKADRRDGGPRGTQTTRTLTHQRAI